MSPKTLIYIGMAVGSAVGGLIPSIWGAGVFSMSSTILTAVGGFAGIWAGYKLSRMM